MVDGERECSPGDLYYYYYHQILFVRFVLNPPRRFCLPGTYVPLARSTPPRTSPYYMYIAPISCGTGRSYNYITRVLSYYCIIILLCIVILLLFLFLFLFLLQDHSCDCAPNLAAVVPAVYVCIYLSGSYPCSTHKKNTSSFLPQADFTHTSTRALACLPAMNCPTRDANPGGFSGTLGSERRKERKKKKTRRISELIILLT